MKHIRQIIVFLCFIFIGSFQTSYAISIAYANSLEEINTYDQFLREINVSEGIKEKKADVISDIDPILETFGKKQKCYLLKKGEEIKYNVSVEKDGLYTILLQYFPATESFSNLDVSVKVNNKSQFLESNSIRLQTDWTEEGGMVLNRYGDEVVPNQNIVKKWYEKELVDAKGNEYYPYQFYFKKGANKISITNLSVDFVVSDLHINGIDRAVHYDEYKSNISKDVKVFDGINVYEAEKIDAKNKASIIAESITDPSISPYDSYHKKINAIGYESFFTKGDQISWKINVKETGRYKIAFKIKQNDGELLNSPVFRTIKIDDKIPFQEMESYKFEYTPKWFNHILKNAKGEAYYFYLEKGSHTISMTIDNGIYKETMDCLEQVGTQVNDFALQMKKMTGNTVDRNRDFNIKEYFPDIDQLLTEWEENLEHSYRNLSELSEKDTKASVTVKEAIRLLSQLAKNPDDLPNQLSALSEGGNSIVKSLANAREYLNYQPLTLDKFYVFGEQKLESPEASFWTKTSRATERFLGTFRNQETDVKEEEKEIKVWISRSRSYVDALQQLIDTEFTPQTGIKVTLSMMPEENKIILACASNTNPDMAIGLSTNMPYELGERNAVADLAKMNGFNELMKEFKPGAFLSYVIDDSIYGFPETQDFWVLYYRKDIIEKLGIKIPDTWDDVKDILPVLQRYGMNFVPNAATFTAYKPFAATLPAIFQNEGQVLHPDGMSTGINDEESLIGLKNYTDLFTLYSLPTQVGRFYSHIKAGDYPIGIGAMETYLQLTVAADELSGKWDIAPLPGVKNKNGEVIRYAPGSASSSVIFDNTEKKEEAWEFLKWYMSTNTQIQYSNLLYSKYGDGFLWNSANIHAFKESQLPEEHKNTILEQWEWLVEAPRVPGHYMIERQLSDVWNRVVFDGVNIREAVDDAAIIINHEIYRKMKDYKYIVNDEIVKEYKLPTLERLERWGEDEKKEDK